MPQYEWRGQGTYQDNANDRVVEPGEEVELSERIAGPQPEMVEVVESTDEDVEPESEDVEAESEDTYTESELEDMEWSELQPLAANAETDEINGHSSQEEIVEYFTGREK